MNRRNFLKILGAGVTIPLIPKAAAKELIANEDNPFKKNYRQEFINGFEQQRKKIGNGTLILKGGYEEEAKYFWLETKIIYEKKEWYDLVRTVEPSIDQAAKNIAGCLNSLMLRNNHPYMVTEQQIWNALNG